MRLVRKDSVRFVDSGHGEVAVPEIAGRMGTLISPVQHFAFSKGIADWLDRHNRYSSREAKLELSGGQAVVSWKKLFSTDRAQRRHGLRSLSRRLPCRRFLRFLYQFVLKRGFLDGRAGFEFCRLMSMYEWWIRLKCLESESDTGKVSKS
jgi:hypothetical protein